MGEMCIRDRIYNAGFQPDGSTPEGRFLMSAIYENITVVRGGTEQAPISLPLPTSKVELIRAMAKVEVIFRKKVPGSTLPDRAVTSVPVSYTHLDVYKRQDYARSEGKTVFLTSHIIQDMERLVDDCIIMDYGKILIQKPIAELLEKGRRYTFTIPEGYELPASDDFYHPSVMRNQLETFSFLQPAETEAKLKSMSVPYTNFHSEQVNRCV